MDIQKLRLKEQQSLNLGSCITSISCCNQFFGVGCLDDSLRVWRTNLSPLPKQPAISQQESISCMTDVAFMRNSTHVASISMDAALRVWDIDTGNLTTIDTPMLSAWRIVFAGDSIITCGDLGRVAYYDLFSREVIKRMEVGDSLLNAMAISRNDRTLALGNINGDAFLLDVQDRDKMVTFKPHFRTIRSLQFTHSSDKLLSSSDDCSIAVTHTSQARKQVSLEGHSDRVNAIRSDDRNPNIVYSCSADKTARIWDMRAGDCVETYRASGPLLAMSKVGRHLVTGGELGTLHVLQIE